MFTDLINYNDLFFIRIDKMTGVVHETDHAYPVIAWISYQCTICSVCYKFTQYFCILLGFVVFYFKMWIAVFWRFILLSPVCLFCECCRMSQL